MARGSGPGTGVKRPRCRRKTASPAWAPGWGASSTHSVEPHRRYASGVMRSPALMVLASRTGVWTGACVGAVTHASELLELDIHNRRHFVEPHRPATASS